MTRLLWPLQWLALAGFLASALVHLLALLQLPVPAQLQPYINAELFAVLSSGIFVVWIPTVLVAGRVNQGYGPGGMSWQALLKGCPDWMRYSVYGLFGYALLNFFLSIGVGHNPAESGEPVLAQRAFSGHWLLFYGAAFAVMYSVSHRPALLEAKTCAAGHAVGVDDQFCPSCGQPLPRDI